MSSKPAFVLCGLVLLAGLAHGDRFMVSSRGRQLQQTAPTPLAPEMCQESPYISAANTPNNIFDQLSPQEYMATATWMVETYGFLFPALLNQTSPPPDSDFFSPMLNTSAANGGMPEFNESYIYNIMLYPANKTEALAYLDAGGPAPERSARVIVVRSGEVVPDVMEYKVGPLPISADTKAEMLYQPGQIPWLKRPSSDMAERTAMRPILDDTNAVLTPLFMAVVGQCLDPNNPACDGNNISQWSQPAWVREDGHNRIKVFWNWLQPSTGGSGDELYAIPIYFKLNTTSRDPTEWYTFDFEHCTQGFDTAEALIEALDSGNLTVCSAMDWASPTYNPMWSDDVTQGPTRQGSSKPGPRLYEPQGKRFSLMQGESPTARVFEWMGWEAHVTIHPWTGIQLHNVKFKDERILYELALQDQFVAYSGYQSVGSSYYFDATYQLGGEEYTLRPGYDCPETASFVDVNVMGEYGQLLHYKGGWCIFEDSTSTTTWRHFDYEDYVSTARDRGVRNYELVLRTIATVGNYDYMYDIRFQLDGEIRVQVNMAGYMQNTFFDDQWGLTMKDKKFGTRTHNKALSNIHDHLTSWKLDFDIGGTSNNFHKTAIKVGTYDDIFGEGSTPLYSSPTAQYKYADDTLVTNEAGYKLNSQQPTIFTIQDDNAVNEWGAPRSYGIFHQYTAPQLLPDDHPLLKAAAWTKYNIAVTVRKEDEQTSSKDYYDMHSPMNPVWSLDMALNNESVVEQDLVAWLSMGIIHVPRAEDVPLISNLGSEFQLKPINFFNALASLDVVDNDDFTPCMPKQGAVQFDYSWSTSGNNYQFDKAAFTLANTQAVRESVAAATATGGK